MQIVGIKKDKDFYHIASLSQEKGQTHIHFIETVRADELEERLQGADTCLVAGVASQEVLLRTFTSPIKKRSLLKRTLPFKMKDLFPFKVEPALCKVIIDQIGKGSFVKIFAAYNAAQVERHLTQYPRPLDVLSLEPLALFRFALFLEEKEKDFLIFYFDYAEILIEVIENRQLKQYISLDISELGLVQELESMELGGKHAEKLTLEDYLAKGGQIVVEKLQQKIDRALCFLLEDAVQEEGRKVLFAGRSETFPIVEIFFLNRQEHFSPMVISNKQGFHVSTVLSHAIPIGLGLDVLSDDRLSCQWLVGQFFPKHHKTFFMKRLKKHLFICATLLVCAMGLFALQVSQAERKLGAPIDVLFEEFGAKHPQLLGGLNEVTVEGKIDFANQVISKYGLEKSAFESVPQAGRCFHYLSQLGALKELASSNQFSVTKLDYRVVQRPTFSKPGIPYQVQVALCFVSSDHNKAVKLYEEINQDKTHIDLKKGVSWKGRKNKYEISFFFKG